MLCWSDHLLNIILAWPTLPIGRNRSTLSQLIQARNDLVVAVYGGPQSEAVTGTAGSQVSAVRGSHLQPEMEEWVASPIVLPLTGQSSLAEFDGPTPESHGPDVGGGPVRSPFSTLQGVQFLTFFIYYKY